MEEILKSQGECLFCKKMFSRTGINRHIRKHLEQETIQGRPGKSYLLKIELDTRWGSGPYFLSLWIDGEARMGDLDQFLRDIWLECCGHMSSFTNPKNKSRNTMFNFFEAEELMAKGKIKEYEDFMEDSNGEVPMSRKVKKVFEKGLKLKYEYDFGSTTALELVVMGEYNIQALEPIVLISRNEPLQFPCSSCGSPAIQICDVCSYEKDAFFCKKCAKAHAKDCEDFAEYAAAEIVNSPRMGVCGYEGGRIDLERDTAKKRYKTK